ncbi:hypothetical protein [Stenotrophomonas sp. MMGLT7]|uniref:hypothetical protein n=1 Tax=Stenotrophomonas sp. MMGLT7 TaxID=2901227 RepID=UPI001E42A95E|nr:hypothetical protein [Stenotrophomonas sp. MMGLT7]MCD7100005.1 hypothetical protein [Stenotrophomonas sp. MMGLT7]
MSENLYRHPAAARIDLDRPAYRRAVTHVLGCGQAEEIVVEMWNPVQLDNGGWVCPLRVERFDTFGAFPGRDPLDALLNAMSVARWLFNDRPGKFRWEDRDYGGFPLLLDVGLPEPVHAGVERKALDARNDAWSAYGVPRFEMGV